MAVFDQQTHGRCKRNEFQVKKIFHYQFKKILSSPKKKKKSSMQKTYSK